MYETEKMYEFQTRDVSSCLKAFMDGGVDVSRISIRSRNLEDLFLELTGHGLRL